MAKKKSVRVRSTRKKSVHVTPHGDKWAVKREGTERASSVHRTQKEAEKKGRETARHNKTEFFLHNRQGNIRERNSYGNEPYPPIQREVRRYTEEDLKVFAKEDELDPERAQRLKVYLRTT